jgi:Sulfatase
MHKSAAAFWNLFPWLTGKACVHFESSGSAKVQRAKCTAGESERLVAKIADHQNGCEKQGCAGPANNREFQASHGGHILRVLPAWDSLTTDQKKLLARQMEVYAGFLAHTDYEVGRLLENIKAQGHNEDTIVFYIVSDNGASAEGGLDGHDALTVEGKRHSIEERLKHMDDLGGERSRTTTQPPGHGQPIRCSSGASR